MNKLIFILFLGALLISACEKSEVNENNESEVNTTLNTTLDDEDQNVNETTNSTGDNETYEVGKIGTCEESDDEKEYDTWGYVEINDSKEYLDECISDGYLREYYCDEIYPGNLKFELYKCEELCESGECVEIDEDEDNETNTTS